MNSVLVLFAVFVFCPEMSPLWFVLATVWIRLRRYTHFYVILFSSPTAGYLLIRMRVAPGERVG